MELNLVVINGKHAGRTIRVKGSKFSIGRSRDCHLRPGSDRVSRHHCVILVEASRVVVRDLDSRNGTFVNGEKIEGDRALENADRLTIGRLELEVQMTADSPSRSAAGSKKTAKASKPTAKPKSTKSKPSKAAPSPVAMSDDDLELADQPAAPSTSSDPTADQPTQVLKPGNIKPTSAHPEQPEAAEEPEVQNEDQKTDHEVCEADKEKARKERAIVGVSKATQAKRVTSTSSGAAAEALRKFFQ